MFKVVVFSSMGLQQHTLPPSLLCKDDLGIQLKGFGENIVVIYEVLSPSEFFVHVIWVVGKVVLLIYCSVDI